MAKTLVYSAELRDMFTGNMMKWQVEILVNDTKVESVHLIGPEGDRERCSMIEPLPEKKRG